MAPCSVSTPAKGVPLGRIGRTPDFVVESKTGGGGGASTTCNWADTRAARPREARNGLYMLEGVLLISCKDYS
jgi:hypothetical protein